MGRSGRAALAVAGLAGAAAIALVAARLAHSEPTELLPNLDQAAPGALRGRTEETKLGRRFFVGFESAAANVGEGPLTLVARRATRADPRMALVQEVARSDGATRAVPLATTLRYVRSPTHSHWHLLGFMRYELRREPRVSLRDRKTGFCLGDRYRAGVDRRGAETRARYTGECGKGAPNLTRLRVGISVGWGDDYAPHLEGQEFDITGLPAGRYLLVHRVNPQRILQESDYADNVASLAFVLSWPRGSASPPRIEVIGRCPASAACG